MMILQRQNIITLGRRAVPQIASYNARRSKSGNDGIQKALSIIENAVTNVNGGAGGKSKLPRELLALPVHNRPLFPEFFKAISIKDKGLIKCVQDNLKANNPYVSVFLTRTLAEQQMNQDQDQSSSSSQQQYKQGDQKEVNGSRSTVKGSSEIRSSDVIKSIDDIHPVGVVAQIFNVLAEPSGSMTLLLYPMKRVKMEKFISPQRPLKSSAELSSAVSDQKEDDQSPATDVKALNSKFKTSCAKVVALELKDEPFDTKDSEIQQLSRDIVATLNEMAKLNPLVRDQVSEFVRGMSVSGSFKSNGGVDGDGNSNLAGVFNEDDSLKSDDPNIQLTQHPSKLADFAAAMSDVPGEQLQQILETTNVKQKLELSYNAIRKEMRNAELQSKISADLEQLISDSDRQAFLNKRLRNIQKELGVESQSRDKIMNKYRKRVEALNMPDYAKKVFEEEMGKLNVLKPSAQEYNLTNNYLDWITSIPWGKSGKDSYSISRAQQVLDEDHYGLKDVKDRILEFVAVAKLRHSIEGKIICMQGPPGVGKTSIAKSIARALDRQFYRFSVGGLYDVAEIKGHRRTYVGAMPGKLVQALKKVQTENPLILIDEIDKVGHGGSQGDPASALLEVLDPEQNTTFMDHYMDMPLDLSKVLFVCTANVMDTIPGPLLDRMEVIQLSGYIAEEKMQIAQKYLIPQILKQNGVSEDRVQVGEDALRTLMDQYCRESGVRNLKKHLEKVVRKSALRIVQGEEMVKVDAQNLKSFVGNPVFQRKQSVPGASNVGVVTGLAWTGMGGDTLTIECLDKALPVRNNSNVESNNNRNGRSSAFIKLTGQLGDVMKESAQIAYSYAQKYIHDREPQNLFFDKAQIHLHVPEGAIKKDGPSAGITMCSALLSLATGKPIPTDVAMTGELTLTGKVLKIGGVKEKIIAAKRDNIKTVLLPKDNAADWAVLDDTVKHGVEVHFVDSYKDVADILFSQ
ncbi:hypothetical protein MIR68_004529 [Amoeboaphelidium protococcarum]|nr:hypothetical protein MIR68_004529 [Amoeboaphelidium protococcarum]